MPPGTYDSLDGQVALVMGATRGIGAAIASDLAGRGATVYAGARDPDDVTGSSLRPIRLDVTDDEERRAAVESRGDFRGRHSDSSRERTSGGTSDDGATPAITRE